MPSPTAIFRRPRRPTAVAAWVYKKIQKNMTPAIEQKVQDTLNSWFGYDIKVE